MKYFIIILTSWILLIGIQNLIVADNVRRSNKCKREQNVHYTKCVPTVRFYNYLTYNIGECIGFKYFPVGKDIDNDLSLKNIACGELFNYEPNEWGY